MIDELFRGIDGGSCCGKLIPLSGAPEVQNHLYNISLSTRMTSRRAVCLDDLRFCLLVCLDNHPVMSVLLDEEAARDTADVNGWTICDGVLTLLKDIWDE